MSDRWSDSDNSELFDHIDFDKPSLISDSLFEDDVPDHFNQLNRVRVSVAPPLGSVPLPGMSVWEAERLHKLHHEFPTS